TPSDVFAGANASDAAGLLLFCYPRAVDCWWRGLVDCCGAWFCTLACVWSVSPLVFLCSSLHDYLPPPFSVVWSYCFHGYDAVASGSFNITRCRFVFQSVCGAWSVLRNNGLRQDDQPS